MRVKLFANLAEAAGARDIELDVDDGTTVEEALERVFERHPPLRDQVLDEDGTLAEHINLLVNGSTIDGDASGLSHSLAETDELAIFPPVTGGTSPR